MSKHTELFDFLCELIDVQIKKYVQLASRGIGPDARLNAVLVYEEVEELIELAGSLFKEIEKNLQFNGVEDSKFNNVFQQVKFYIEQEQLRGYAGWLLDDNKIHAAVDSRTAAQSKQLATIAKLAEINFTEESQPVTDIQRQCQHDSNQIAYFILKLAKEVKANPQMEFDKKIPIHAQPVLRRNAIGRYSDFAEEIDNLYTKSDRFLKDSDLKARTSVLTKEDALSYANAHELKRKELLQNYKKIAPNSRLFSTEYVSYEVAVPDASPVVQTTKNSIFSSRNLLLFSGVVLAGSVLVFNLLPYLTQHLDEDLSSTLKI